MPWPQPTRMVLSERTARRLWIVAMLDMVGVAWMIAIGSWLDNTSRLTAVITLGGHHKLVMIMALVGFAILAGLALMTNGFTSANQLHVALIVTACVISVVALAGALSAVLLLALAALLLGSGIRLLLRR
jgi:TRAP-type C4-dicarboxylate transport system permease small subunit